MKIGIIEGTTQKEKNLILNNCVRKAVSTKNEIINFGIYPDSLINLSYVQISLAIALLINSEAVNFIVTGCSSGQGMMLACNTFSKIQCGYIPTPHDAFLFSQINNGNVVSFPLGLNWGWCGEVNCFETMKALFSKKMGQGYPPQDAKRKIKNNNEVKQFNVTNKIPLEKILPKYDKELLDPVLSYSPVYDYILKQGKNQTFINTMKKLKL